MAVAERHLHLVRPAGTPDPVPDLGIDGELEDLVVTGTLFAVSFLPIASALAHVGRWSGGTLGLGAAGSFFAGRALWACAGAAIRARRRS